MPDSGVPRRTAADPMAAWRESALRSRRFDDVYFSTTDGLAEARAVFLQGCGLPEAWAGRRRFVVGELGFGTGLNLVALLELWGRTREAGAQLHLFSLEAFPLARADAARALAGWPELAGPAEGLLARWPDDRPGLHRLDFLALGARLDLWIGEAAEGLAAWTGRAQAWFLDGFAPARNPEMWRPEVLDLVAARSAPGARAASFTVAGEVRRTLQRSGFVVAKAPGFGRKRERLEARLGGDTAAETRPPARVAVIGAGVAGAAVARALKALGCAPLLVEVGHPGAGASGNPAALVMPRLDAGGGAIARLHAQAFARAVDLYQREAAQAVIAEGALQLESSPRDAKRFDRIAAWDGWATGAVRRLDATEAAGRLGEPSAAGALLLAQALAVEPAVILDAWLQGVEVVTAEVATLERTGDGWRLGRGDHGAPILADAVVLACGPHASALAARAGGEPPPLQPVRGQVSWTRALQADASVAMAAAWGGYALPLRGGGVLFGATHRRGDLGTEARPDEALENRNTLAAGRPALAAALARDPEADVRQRASLRAATPDHLPLAGALGDGLFILGGLGGRGFTLAPLLGEHVVGLALGAPSPLTREAAALVDPLRFAARGRNKTRPPPLR